MITILVVTLWAATAASLWFVPIFPIDGFAANRATYQKSFSLAQIDNTILRQHSPALAIDFTQLQIRLGGTLALGWGLAIVCTRILNRRRRRDEP